MAGRLRRQSALAVAVVVPMAVAVAGLLVAYVSLAWPWAGLLGVGQGGALGMALAAIVMRTRDARAAAHLSAMSQTWGYLLTATGPLVLGAVHQATGDWTLPPILLLAVCVALLGVGWVVGRRDRYV